MLLTKREKKITKNIAYNKRILPDNKKRLTANKRRSMLLWVGKMSLEKIIIFVAKEES